MEIDIKHLTIYALTGFLVFTIACIAIVLWKAVHEAKGKEPAIFGRIFSGENSVRLVTVALVVICASYMALSDSLSQGAASLLSGVAGFVLGGMKKEA